MLVGRKWPGNAPGHEWKKAGDVVEVDDALGQELVAIPDGGFYEVVPDSKADDAGKTEVVEAPAPKRSRARKTDTSGDVSE